MVCIPSYTLLIEEGWESNPRTPVPKTITVSRSAQYCGSGGSRTPKPVTAAVFKTVSLANGMCASSYTSLAYWCCVVNRSVLVEYRPVVSPTLWDCMCSLPSLLPDKEHRRLPHAQSCLWTCLATSLSGTGERGRTHGRERPVGTPSVPLSTRGRTSDLSHPTSSCWRSNSPT